jgi:hypothetical protein
MKRMNPITIDVDAITRLRAGKIAIDAIREAGLNPQKALGVPMIQAIGRQWAQGKMTRAEFIDNCRKVLILNPGLATEP